MYLLLWTMTTQGHHHHHCCERLLARWKDEGDGTRGKGDNSERWYVILFCFLFLFAYQVFFLGSKLLLTTGWYYTTYAHPRTSKPPPPMQMGCQAIRVDRRWRSGTGGNMRGYCCSCSWIYFSKTANCRWNTYYLPKCQDTRSSIKIAQILIYFLF